MSKAYKRQFGELDYTFTYRAREKVFVFIKKKKKLLSSTSSLLGN